LKSERVVTYCTNIHAGEAWSDVLRNLEDHTLAVKRAVSPRASFPLGLRLSARAAAELEENEVHRFRDWCAEHDCRVVTLNGFVHGAFHGERVKAAVYEPDWRSRERVIYTCRLATLLAHWVPSDECVSISTAPIAFRTNFSSEHWPIVRDHLIEALAHLARLRDRGGPEILLAIEPEPCCVVERTEELVELFERLRLPAPLREHLAVCLDCCHQAVEFEQPEECLAKLADARIRIAKVQASSALRAPAAQARKLLEFDEPVYLHQATVLTAAGTVLRFADLPEFAAWLERAEAFEECRVHFHTPVFLDRIGELGTTRFFLERCLPRVAPSIPIEVETYSFDVLPQVVQKPTLVDSIVRELNWVQSALHASHCSH
jgi:sugar phosphate isomerase/epimerase